MKKVMNKRAQHTMGLPFSLIFSIFLIIIFIVVAFMAGKSFLDTSTCAKIGLFYEDFGREVDLAWKAGQVEKEIKIGLPAGIKKICFGNLSEGASITNDGEEYENLYRLGNYKANTFLYPQQKACDMPYKYFKNLDIESITAEKNPYCIEANKPIKISKGIYDKLVKIQ